jgi:23S rRNA (cytidine1920-2'-O)/16S rRNA (cytidine1409-2'-O)-methyltransferase
VRRRLDVEMVRRGLAINRTEAGHAIRSGKVMVSGRLAAKAGTLVLPEEPIVMSAPARKFVSRAGEKLEAALVGFGIDVAGRLALDAGASTGGFTDCLLSRGAAQVVAVDVGYGQLDFRLREDPRVTVLERTNVRDLEPADLPYLPEVVTADLSFISLSLVLPALVRCSAPEATFVLLVKPQFEAGRGQAPGGVVHDPAVWRSTLDAVAIASTERGLSVLGFMASPLRGPAGNVEFLMHAVRPSDAAPAPTAASAEDRAERIGAAVRQAEAMTSSSHA